MVLKRSEQAGESQVSSEVDERCQANETSGEGKGKGNGGKWRTWKQGNARSTSEHEDEEVEKGTRGGCDCWDCTHCWEYIDDEGVQRGLQMLPKNINIRPCDAGVSANRKRGGNRQVAFRLLKDWLKDAPIAFPTEFSPRGESECFF